jgi:hypothetical protein
MTIGSTAFTAIAVCCEAEPTCFEFNVFQLELGFYSPYPQKVLGFFVRLTGVLHVIKMFSSHRNFVNYKCQQK